MSKKNNIKGVLERDELNPNSNIKDLRSNFVKFQAYFEKDGSYMLMMIVTMLASLDVLMLLFRGKSLGVSLIFFLVSGFVFKRSYKVQKLPFKKPENSKEIDENQLDLATSKPGYAKGVYFYGNEIENDEQIWFASDDIRVHALIFGTTGSGKTEALLSICMNSLIHSSGFIYVDGKGDNLLFSKVFAMVRRMGREDDLLIINYMTGDYDFSKKSTVRLSNTMNAFSTGSSSSLSQLVGSLLPTGGDPLWSGRAAIFISALLNVLVYLRNEQKLLLDVGEIRSFFCLPKIEKLLKRDDIPDSIKEGLQSFIWNLPGYQKTDPEDESSEDLVQEFGTLEQFGFITMQYTQIFGMLADEYGHIMKTQLSEVDFYDVVVNRRILVVLLPSMEKAPQTLGNLGRIIISSVKSMMVTGLGNMVEGDKKDYLDAKPTNAPSAYITLFDEYGSYAVEGAAVMPAQARSLGFAMIFSGQNYQAFKGGSADEAASIIANCGVKMCMKLEDPTETFEIFSKATGEALVSSSNSAKYDENATLGGYIEDRQAVSSMKKRMDIRDLKSQEAGEGHLVYGDRFVRFRMFYANPKLTQKQRINRFLQVGLPDYHEIRRMVLSYNRMKRAFKSFLSKEASNRKSKVDMFINKNNGSDLNFVLDKYKKAYCIKDLQSRALFALYSHIKEQRATDLQLENDIDALNDLNSIEEEYSDKTENEFGVKPVFSTSSESSVSVREKISNSYRKAVANRKITQDDMSGTDKLRESLQKSHIKNEDSIGIEDSYNQIEINASDLQNDLVSLEDKIIETHKEEDVKRGDITEDHAVMATEKVVLDIGMGVSYPNEVKIQKRKHNKDLIKVIIDDIILSEVD